jgi:hypothetical protein
MYLTGYSYWDNTPPGSPAISHPVIHQTAGGTGTFADPITLATGHDLSSGTQKLEYSAGTKFYIPNIRKYAIVEDTCGDGPTPQNIACWTSEVGHPNTNQVDIYIDGQNDTSTDKDASGDCMEAITRVGLIIQNPASNYAVNPGPVFGTSCATQYGDTVVTS